jgi:hypothetical protein
LTADHDALEVANKVRLASLVHWCKLTSRSVSFNRIFSGVGFRIRVYAHIPRSQYELFGRRMGLGNDDY